MSLSITKPMTEPKHALPEQTTPEGDCIVCGGDVAEVNADGGYCLSCGRYSPAGEASMNGSNESNTVTNDIPF